MRAFLTILLATVAVTAFTVFFALHAVLSFVESPDAVAETAAESGVHDWVAAAASRIIGRELPKTQGSELVRAYIDGNVRAEIGRTFAPDWFYESVARAYGGALEVIHRGNTDVVIALAAKRTAFAQGLDAVAENAKRDCAALIGADACRDPQAVRAAMAAYDKTASRLSRSIPDALDISALMSQAEREMARSAGPSWETIGRYLDWASTVKLAALIVLIIAFAGIAILARASIGQLYITVGGTLAVSAGVYLITVYVTERLLATRRLEDALAAYAERASLDDAAAAAVAEGGVVFLGNAFHAAIHADDAIVIALFAAGVVAVIAGVLLLRRRSEKRWRHRA